MRATLTWPLAAPAELHRSRTGIALAALILASVAGLAARFFARASAARSRHDVPITFWSWQSAAPSQSDVDEAFRTTGARTLFLRAGQIDYSAGSLARIRRVKGPVPGKAQIHLVYNSTPDMLAKFESLDPAAISAAVIAAFKEDCSGSVESGATIAGLQLDLDVPARLLPRYQQVLQLVRADLPAGAALSITGLPSWMSDAPEPSIKALVAAVDFWIPQCYGAAVPDRLSTRMPIVSPAALAGAMDGARRLGAPFYAGLAAYGYAIHYSSGGTALQLVGDLDPALAANEPGLQLEEREPYKAASGKGQGSAEAPGEWRYVYKATVDCRVGEIEMRSGEKLLIDAPSAEGLAASARIARERGGARMLGLCIFRLPARGDSTNLSVEEISAALVEDAPPADGIQIAAKAETGRVRQTVARARVIFAAGGRTRAMLGDDAITIELHVPVGMLEQVRLEGFAACETLYQYPGTNREPVACSIRRANTIRIIGHAWGPGSTGGVTLEGLDLQPSRLAPTVTVHSDTGRLIRKQIDITHWSRTDE